MSFESESLKAMAPLLRAVPPNNLIEATQDDEEGVSAEEAAAWVDELYKAYPGVLARDWTWAATSARAYLEKPAERRPHDVPEQDWHDTLLLMALGVCSALEGAWQADILALERFGSLCAEHVNEHERSAWNEVLRLAHAHPNFDTFIEDDW